MEVLLPAQPPGWGRGWVSGERGLEHNVMWEQLPAVSCTLPSVVNFAGAGTVKDMLLEG